jgi:Holliday junction resolvase RusA-like endonuclease
MPRLNLKPLSLNLAYRGRRFATQELKDFKGSMMLLVPKMEIPDGELALTVIYGTSKASDLDNLNKTFIDGLSEAYGFNDNRVYKIVMEKVPVKKGEEFIEFMLTACG